MRYSLFPVKKIDFRKQGLFWLVALSLILVRISHSVAEVRTFSLAQSPESWRTHLVLKSTDTEEVEHSALSHSGHFSILNEDDEEIGKATQELTPESSVITLTQLDGEVISKIEKSKKTKEIQITDEKGILIATGTKKGQTYSFYSPSSVSVGQLQKKKEEWAVKIENHEDPRIPQALMAFAAFEAQARNNQTFWKRAWIGLGAGATLAVYFYFTQGSDGYSIATLLHTGFQNINSFIQYKLLQYNTRIYHRSSEYVDEQLGAKSKSSSPSFSFPSPPSFSAKPENKPAEKTQQSQNKSEQENPNASQNICIASHFGEQKLFSDLAIENHKEYSKKHGYFYHVFRGRISGDQFKDWTNENPIFRDGLYWQKVTAVQRMLNKNECSWIMWIDSDAIFTDHNRKIEEIIARYAPPTQNSWWGWSTEKHLLMPSDESGTVPWIKINNGVFLIKNSDWSHQFINSVAAKYSLYKNNGTPEQDAFQDLIFNHFPRDSFKAQNRSESDFSEWNLASEVALVPQRVMDSFYREPKYSDPAGANWRIGDFIAHLSGISAEDRLAGIRRIQEILRPFQEKN